MAFFECKNANVTRYANMKLGSFEMKNTNDPNTDPKYVTYTIPVDKKPKIVIIYKNCGGIPLYHGSTPPLQDGISGNYQLDQATACYYNEDISTTQYLLQCISPSVASANRCRMVNLGSTSDECVLRSISDTEVTCVAKVAYKVNTGYGQKWYGGSYDYYIFW